MLLLRFPTSKGTCDPSHRRLTCIDTCRQEFRGFRTPYCSGLRHSITMRESEGQLYSLVALLGWSLRVKMGFLELPWNGLIKGHSSPEKDVLGKPIHFLPFSVALAQPSPQWKMGEDVPWDKPSICPSLYAKKPD